MRAFFLLVGVRGVVGLAALIDTNVDPESPGQQGRQQRAPTNGYTTAVERIEEGVSKKPMPVWALTTFDAEGIDVCRVHRQEEGKMELRHPPNGGVLG